MLSATFSHLFSVAVPALPGATKLLQLFHLERFSMPMHVHDRHYPKTKMFILNYPF